MPTPLRAAGIAAISIGTCLAVLFVAGYVLVRYTDVRVPFLSDTCRIYSGEHVVKLKPSQLTYAATIAAVGTVQGVGEHGVAIALTAAMQESKLRNLSDGDRDSIGLFQQRPSQGWGTAAQLRDPHYASTEFFVGLRRIRGWASMSIAQAAQKVQRSAHPTAYDKWATDAAALARALLGRQSRAVTCKLRQETKLSGSCAAVALRREYARDYPKSSLSTASDHRGPRLTLHVPADNGAGDDRATGSAAGWRAAHWFVAKSRDYGVMHVAYDGARWGAYSGRWERYNGARIQQLIVELKG